jgi:hypothetical protein
MELFSEEEVYDNQISPLMTQIIAICNEHQIPMLASFVYENDEDDGVGHCTTLLNGFADRKSEEIQEANGILRNNNNHLMAFTITKSN